MSTRGKRWIIANHIEGFPKDTDVKLEEFDLPAIKDGELLLEAEYFSVDPYMRLMIDMVPLGEPIMGESVSKVIKSKNPKFPIGTYVRISAGWSTHAVSDGNNLTEMTDFPANQPRTYSLGVLGMPGVAAYFGFLEICEPIKAGETVFVSSGAGAVGSIVGQIAKIKGCRVVGSTGSDAKVAYMKDIGYDAAFNYKTAQDFDAAIKAVAPEGIDIFFDNVGGEFATAVIRNMNEFGRMACCGSVSTYNDTTQENVTPIFVDVVMKQLTMKGFVTFKRYMSRFPEAITQLTRWISEGKIQVRETVTEGFDNMFNAFLGLFAGENIGKTIVKV